MLYYFVEFAGSFANIALLLLFIGRLFPKKEPVSRWFYAYVALLIAGQCALSLFPDWVTQRTIYLLVGGFFLALLFYEVRLMACGLRYIRGVSGLFEVASLACFLVVYVLARSRNAKIIPRPETGPPAVGVNLRSAIIPRTGSSGQPRN